MIYIISYELMKIVRFSYLNGKKWAHQTLLPLLLPPTCFLASAMLAFPSLPWGQIKRRRKKEGINKEEWERQASWFLMMSLYQKEIHHPLCSHIDCSLGLCIQLSLIGGLACVKTAMCVQVHGRRDTWQPWNSQGFVVKTHPQLSILPFPLPPSFPSLPRSISLYNEHQQVIFLEPWQ